ncbi:MAG: hypothetical protein Salg2KO_17850 [Salibacteraceae bacterium]
MKSITPFSIFAATALLLSTSCNDTTSVEADASKPPQGAATLSAADLKIAYVNTDTLFERYELRNELEEEFIEEKLVMENRFKQKVEAFEKDYRDAEAGAAQLSQESLQILSMKLQEREQELMVSKQEMEGQLMQSEQLKNDKLFEGLRTFLDEYASSNGYHAIYGYNGYGDVLYMDPQFDITNEVVSALNTKYQQEKTAETAEE